MVRKIVSRTTYTSGCPNRNSPLSSLVNTESLVSNVVVSQVDTSSRPWLALEILYHLPLEEISVPHLSKSSNSVPSVVLCPSSLPLLSSTRIALRNSEGADEGKLEGSLEGINEGGPEGALDGTTVLLPFPHSIEATTGMEWNTKSPTTFA